MKRIIIVTTILDAGGITAFLVPLANFLSEQGNEVTLAYTGDKGSYLGLLNPGIKLLKYKAPGKYKKAMVSVIRGHIKDLIRIKKRNHTHVSPIDSIQRIARDGAYATPRFKQHYDIAISSAEFYCNAFVAFRINATKKIGWIHPDIRTLHLDMKYSNYLIDNLDNLVTVSLEGCAHLKNAFPKHANKITYIKNMVDIEKIMLMSNEPVTDFPRNVGETRILTVCRIDNSSKRLDRVVSISKEMKRKGYSFKWYIIGDGPDYQMMLDLIRKNQIADIVVMLGKKENPYPYIKQADVFALTSQYEGMPVVIDEAKILHTPIITTKYDSAEEQLKGYGAFIVDNNDISLVDQFCEFIVGDTWGGLKERAKAFNYSNEESKQRIQNLILGE